MAVGFYAGLKRGSRSALLAGPYKTKKQAERALPKAHDAAMEVDRFCHFDVPGVFRVECDKLPTGVLNSKLQQ